MVPTSLILPVLALFICFVNGESSCTTPTGGSGTCKSLYECTPMLEIVKKKNKSAQDLDIMKKSECGVEGTTPLVCCPNPCYTPEGQTGACVSIYSCPHLGKLLKTPVSQENMQYVQNSKCKGLQEYSVCCGPPRDQTVVVPNGDCAASVTAFPPDPRTECCGRDSRFVNKIVGGNATAVDQYPWLVLIEYIQLGTVKLLCGGALISGKYVLTAAHCVAGDILEYGTPKNVRLGEYDKKHDGKDCVVNTDGSQECTDGMIRIAIERTIPHPDYDTNKKQTPNDIGLIRLKENAPFTDFIRPICLPTLDTTLNPPVNFTMFAAGWGKVSRTLPSSNVKLHVDLPLVGKNMCEPAYNSGGRNLRLTNGQLCAGGVNGKDSCKGDSGGPLMYENEQRLFEIIGVVSYGPTPCGLANVPGVYTKVHEYNAWIRSNIVA